MLKEKKLSKKRLVTKTSLLMIFTSFLDDVAADMGYSMAT